MPSENKPLNGQTLHAKITLIATPIGNLKDITDRAKESLSNADQLWCEDTRVTQKLLSALGICAPTLVRLDQHSKPEQIKKMLAQALTQRQNIGVVSDAGMPGIQDPGSKLIQIAREYFPEIKIDLAPGASSILSALALSGFEGNFIFWGYLPRESNSQHDQWTQALETSIPIHIFFDSPERILKTADSLLKWFEKSFEKNKEAQVFFVKELTKLHQKFFHAQGSKQLEILVQDLRQADLRGEWVFLLDLSKICVKSEKAESNWQLTMKCLLEAGISPANAAKIVSKNFHVAKNLAYETALSAKKIL